MDGVGQRALRSITLEISGDDVAALNDEDLRTHAVRRGGGRVRGRTGSQTTAPATLLSWGLFEVRGVAAEAESEARRITRDSREGQTYPSAGRREFVITRGRFRSGERLNPIRVRFTVPRRARTQGIERVLTSWRSRTGQVPPSFGKSSRPFDAPVPVLSRPRRSEPAPISWREH